MNQINTKQESIKRIIIFYSIAIVISHLFRFDVFDLKNHLSDISPWLSIRIRHILEGSGVFIGALIGIALLKRNRMPAITLLGSLKNKNILMIAIPILVLTIIGVTNDYGLNKHLYGFWAVTTTLLYCIMVEYGWRGYLQEELSSLKPLTKYALVGILWYIWHISLDIPMEDNLLFFIVIICGSWGIGDITDCTKSIIVSACFQLLFQVTMFDSLFINGLTQTQKGIVFGICIFLFILISKKLDKINPFKTSI